MLENKIIITNGKVYRNGTLVDENVFIADGKIIESGNAFNNIVDSDTKIIDVNGKIIIPGFFDIHTHGGKLVDFNHCNKQQVIDVCDFYASCGVTSVLPTVMTDSIDVMKKQLSIISDPEVLLQCPQIKGIHLEGPCLCSKYKGAMPESFLQKCSFPLLTDLQDAAHGMIKLMTLAPELNGAPDFTKQATKLGIHVSMGHSDASYEQAFDVIKAGATSATHTMNVMRLLHQHDPAILTAVMESDIYAEMICDGFHLHPPIVRLLLKVKGYDRMIAVTDSIMAAGCPDGQYILGVNNITVVNGDAKVTENGVRAGSTLTMDKALRNIMRFTSNPIEKIIPLLSENPAKMLGMFDKVGSIDVGKNADIIILDSEYKVETTISQGRVIFTRNK